MRAGNAATVGLTMKNAAFKAGDALTERAGAQNANQALMDELLSGWFGSGNENVAVWADSLVMPAMARRTEAGYTLDNFMRGTGGYDGPCFAVNGASGAEALERGLFDACVSIAYLENGQLVAAVVYDPVHVELFHAIKDLGAYLNGKRITPAKTRSLPSALVSLDHATLRSGTAAALINEAGQIRVAPALGLELCYVACGRVDAALRRGAAFVDCAAGLLVAMEAGAVVTDGRGGTFMEFEEYGQRCDIAVFTPGLADSFAPGQG